MPSRVHPSDEHPSLCGNRMPVEVVRVIVGELPQDQDGDDPVHPPVPPLLSTGWTAPAVEPIVPVNTPDTTWAWHGNASMSNASAVLI